MLRPIQLIVFVLTLTISSACKKEKSSKLKPLIEKKTNYIYSIKFPEKLPTPKLAKKAIAWKEYLFKELNYKGEYIIFMVTPIQLVDHGTIKEGQVFQSVSNPFLFLVYPDQGGSWVIIDQEKKDIWVEKFDIHPHKKSKSIIVKKCISRKKILCESIIEYDQDYAPYNFDGQNVKWSWGREIWSTFEE